MLSGSYLEMLLLLRISVSVDVVSLLESPAEDHHHSLACFKHCMSCGPQNLVRDVRSNAAECNGDVLQVIQT